MSLGTVERLEEAISAIADNGLGDAELDEVVVRLQRARHRLAGVGAGPLARWDSTSVWPSDGHAARPPGSPVTA